MVATYIELNDTLPVENKPKPTANELSRSEVENKVFSHPLSSSVTTTTGETAGSSSGFTQLITTARVEMDGYLGVLEAAIQAEQGEVVSLLLNSLAWENLPADSLSRVIRLSLIAGQHAQARRLAQKAIQRFPNHPDLQKLARVLGPARVVKTNLPPDPTIALNLDWIKKHGENYRGKWVALKAGKFVASADNYRLLVDIIGNPQGTGIFITPIY